MKMELSCVQGEIGDKQSQSLEKLTTANKALLDKEVVINDQLEEINSIKSKLVDAKEQHEVLNSRMVALSGV